MARLVTGRERVHSYPRADVSESASGNCEGRERAPSMTVLVTGGSGACSEMVDLPVWAQA
jgi:hypothetical protein